MISELQVGAGVVYISAAIPGLPNADTSIRALRSNDGTLLWQREFNRSILAALLSITNEAVYVDLVNDDYATPPPQQVHLSVLQASNGEVLWNKDGVRLGAVAAGVAYLYTANNFCAYHADKGTAIWCWQKANTTVIQVMLGE